MAMKKCPVCGASVKVENLERHVADNHPRAKVDLSKLVTEEEKRAAKPKRAAPPPTVTKGGKRLVIVVAIILAIILVLVIVNPFRPHGPQVGDTAPGFLVNACSSGVVSLSSYRNSPTVLELMDANCEACKGEAPVLASVYGTYSTRGVGFLSVSLIDWVPPADTCQSVETFKASYGTNWTYGMDYDRVVRDAYFPGSAGFGTPTTYILDKNGVITRILVGPQTGGSSTYASALDAVLGP